MLSFKEYLIEENNKPENTGAYWKGQSFGEHEPDVRHNSKQPEECTPPNTEGVGFEGQSFGEHEPEFRRNVNSLGEAVTSDKPFIRNARGPLSEVLRNQTSNTGVTSMNKHGRAFDNIHRRPGIRRTKHNSAVENYTGTPSNDPTNGHESSANMNGLGRNLYGDKTSGILHHIPEKVYAGLQRFTSNFKKNAITGELNTFTGIPASIGKLITSGKRTHFAAITSSTTSPPTALNFARVYNGHDDSKVAHILHIHHPKGGTGNAMSVAEESPYEENEIAINIGSRFEYLGTTKVKNNGREIHIHHVNLLKTRVPLPPLSEYTPPVPKIPKQDALTQALTGKIGKK